MNSELSLFLAALVALAVTAWLIARRVSRHVPELQAGGIARKRYRWPAFGKLHGVKVHPTDYVPITSARGNRKRNLTQMLLLAGKPTSGRQRTILRKQLELVARWGGIAASAA